MRRCTPVPSLLLSRHISTRHWQIARLELFKFQHLVQLPTQPQPPPIPSFLIRPPLRTIMRTHYSVRGWVLTLLNHSLLAKIRSREVEQVGDVAVHKAVWSSYVDELVA